jgi:hypothetical protein
LFEISRLEVIMIVGPLAFFIFVIELVRSRRLREDYSLLWLVTFGALVALSVFRNTVLEVIANLMGIAYPPTTLFVIGFGLLLIVMIQFSIVITRLARQNQQAAQHIALLNARLAELERRMESAGGGGD